MKGFYLKILFALVCFTGCETEDDTRIPEPPAYEEVKLLTEIDGELKLKYEDNKIVKGLYRRVENWWYVSAFEVEYQGEKIKRVLFNPDDTFHVEDEFDFSITPENGIYWVHNYHYENDRVKRITNENDEVIMELKYDSKGNVIEEYNSRGYSPSEYSEETITYEYDDESNLVRYKKTTYDEPILEGGIVTDNEINPRYVLFQEFGFVLPPFVSSIAKTGFAKNNIVAIFEGDELKYQANYNYSESYPTEYSYAHYNDEGQRNSNSSFFTYNGY